VLRDIFVVREKKVLFHRKFGDSVPWETLKPILFSLSNYVAHSSKEKVQKTEIVNAKLSYIYHEPLEIFFAFLTDITDSNNLIEKQLKRAKEEFLEQFPDSLITSNADPEAFDTFNIIADLIHKELRPKIALVGFSGVGKTTITRLIKAEEIPMEHIPTMTGDVATVKIGKLHFFLWDFAGQEQFSFLWPKFIKGSDAVLLIMDSTLRNIDKSRFFLDLVSKEVPLARVVGIANKQDIPNALTPKEISDMLKIPVKGMVAVDPNNREKMINIISETLGITNVVSPLLRSFFDRDKEVVEAQEALEKGDLQTAQEKFEAIANHSLELGEEKLASEFFQRAKLIKNAIIESKSVTPAKEIAQTQEKPPEPKPIKEESQHEPELELVVESSETSIKIEDINKPKMEQEQEVELVVESPEPVKSPEKISTSQPEMTVLQNTTAKEPKIPQVENNKVPAQGAIRSEIDGMISNIEALRISLGSNQDTAAKPAPAETTKSTAPSEEEFSKDSAKMMEDITRLRESLRSKEEELEAMSARAEKKEEPTPVPLTEAPTTKEEKISPEIGTETKELKGQPTPAPEPPKPAEPESEKIASKTTSEKTPQVDDLQNRLDKLKSKKKAIELEILDLESDLKNKAISQDSFDEQVQLYKKLRDKLNKQILELRTKMMEDF